MWFEIIRWFSIALCWIATGLNIIGLIRLNRTARALDRMRDEWFKKYLELIEKEQGIELFDKDSRQ